MKIKMLMAFAVCCYFRFTADHTITIFMIVGDLDYGQQILRGR